MKECVIPQDLVDIMIEAQAAAKLRDRYVMLRYFGYRLALKAAIQSEWKSREFWRRVIELYPEMSGKKFHFDHNTKLVVEDD
jgi:hypothetical protein